MHERTVCNKCMMCMIRSFLACALDRVMEIIIRDFAYVGPLNEEESVFLQVKVMRASPP